MGDRQEMWGFGWSAYLAETLWLRVMTVVQADPVHLSNLKFDEHTDGSPNCSDHFHTYQSRPICVKTVLSTREAEVLNLLVQGQTNKEIALTLNVSVKTIEFHLTRIYVKLEIKNRGQAVRKVLQSDDSTTRDDPT